MLCILLQNFLSLPSLCPLTNLILPAVLVNCLSLWPALLMMMLHAWSPLPPPITHTNNMLCHFSSLFLCHYGSHFQNIAPVPCWEPSWKPDCDSYVTPHTFFFFSKVLDTNMWVLFNSEYFALSFAQGNWTLKILYQAQHRSIISLLSPLSSPPFFPSLHCTVLPSLSFSCGSGAPNLCLGDRGAISNNTLSCYCSVLEFKAMVILKFFSASNNWHHWLLPSVFRSQSLMLRTKWTSVPALPSQTSVHFSFETGNRVYCIFSLLFFKYKTVIYQTHDTVVSDITCSNTVPTTNVIFSPPLSPVFHPSPYPTSLKTQANLLLLFITTQWQIELSKHRS